MTYDPFATPSQSLLGGDSSPGYDWILDFLKSTGASIPELIGITPSTETLSWRQDNPIGSFSSQLAGMAVPYLGWLRAAKAIPRFNAAIESIGNLQKAPIGTGAAREFARFLPFEAGRVGVSQVVGDQGFGDMLASAGLNLALGSGVAGLLHGAAAAGLRDPGIKGIFPDIDLAMPFTLQARQMREVIDSGKLTGDVLTRAKAALTETLRAARTEELNPAFKYVGDIDHIPGARNDKLTEQLNRWFRVTDIDPQNPKSLVTRKFAQGVDKDFRDRDVPKMSWQDAAARAGLAPGFEEFGQFFRDVSFGATIKSLGAGSKRAKEVDNLVTKNMEPVGDGMYLTREADDGMFILAKKYEGKPGVGSDKDRWAFFKTDQPGHFLPDQERWTQMQVALGRWNPLMNAVDDGGVVYDTLRNAMGQYPLTHIRGLAREPGLIGKTIEKLTPPGIRGQGAEIVERTKELMLEYVAPRMHQFKKSPRANWIVNMTKATYDSAENVVQNIVNGRVAVDSGKNLFFESLRGKPAIIPGEEPARELVKNVSPEAFQEFYAKIWRPKTPLEELQNMVARQEIRPETAEFATKLASLDKNITDSVTKAEQAVGRKPTVWESGHYGPGRTWEGDTRIPLRNEAGEVVAQAGGANRRQAIANAERMEREGVGIIDRAPNGTYSEYQVSQSKDIPTEVRSIIHSPSTILEAQNVRGFKWDTEAFTKDEFMDAFEAHARGLLKYQADMSVGDLLQPSLDALMKEDPAAFRAVVARMRDYSGQQSAWSKIQNQTVDKALGPILGPNSASKIVEITNTALFNFQLGALKLSYPVINALQFIQTVMPEVAFIMGAPPASIAGRYSHFAAGGSRGPVGTMAVLSPLKMTYQGFKEMAQPSPQLSKAFERAVNDRVIDPRLVEEYIGKTTTKIMDLPKVIKGEANFVDWLRGLSEALPALSERMSRSQAFTQGYIIGRDFLQHAGKTLNEDQIYHFARQFTENTMYLYNASDKPRIFTTPAGSAMGLFKNWMFHFMAQMLEYTKEGLVNKNWAPLLWQTTGTVGLGGVAATPLMFAADGFSHMFANKSTMELAYDQWGEKADAVMMGLPAALTGVSLYSAVNTPLSNPVRDASQITSFVVWDRMKALSKAAGAAFDHWQASGEHPAKDKDVQGLLVRAFAPTTIHRALSSFTDSDAIVAAGTRFPITKNASTADKWLYMLGFNPVEIDRANVVAQELYADHTKLRNRAKTLGGLWADAQAEGNSEQMSLILRQTMLWGVDPGQMMREATKVSRGREKDIVQRALQRREIGRYQGIQELTRGGESGNE